jgi:membrane fusion protein, adhesin transport system
MTLMRQSDFAFANDVRAATELRTPRTSRMLLTSAIAMLAVGLTWANFAVLDEVKRGNGKVVPSRQIQIVQSLEGGIVDAILVQEGSIVQQAVDQDQRHQFFRPARRNQGAPRRHGGARRSP